MGEAARKFINRAPRYILRPSDNQYMRYAFEGDSANVYTTTFVNISTTGMAFITHRDNAPQIGELIKLEFQVPAGDQVAWWGQVVRLQTYKPYRPWREANGPSHQEDSEEVLVAIKFSFLPEGHVEQIKKGLRQKSVEIARQRRLRFRKGIIEFTRFYKKQLFLFLLCSLFTVGFLYWLSLPSGNYTEDRGSQWGKRFEWLNISDEN